MRLSLPTRIWLLSSILFTLLAGSLILSLFFKDNTLWMDEILSYILLSDQSLTHLNDAIVSGMDANPPLFTNLYWVIDHFISPNIIFLKSVSVLLFATTLALFYRYTTRQVGTPVTNFIIVVTLVAFTYLNFTLATQIRSYALFLFLSFLYFVSLHQLSRQPAMGKLLAMHTVCGLLLALTHNFGLFYLAAAGAFVVVLWLWSRNQQYAFVLGSLGLIGAGWLLIWYHNFAIQALAGIPHSWIRVPTWQTFFSIVGELAPTPSNKLETVSAIPVLAIGRFLVLAALFIYIAIPRLKLGYSHTVADSAFMLYLMAGFVYGTTILIALVVSLVHTSVFISRYMWPSHLLVIYQVVYAFDYITRKRSPSWPTLNRQTWLVPLYALLMALFIFYQNRKYSLAPVTVMAQLPQLDKRYPIFCESGIYFLPIWFYNRDRPVRFLLDYESAFKPDNELGTSVAYHTFKSVQEKYKLQSIIPVTDFTPSRIPHFFVVDERWNYQIERFIANKSVRVIRVVPTSLDGVNILECVFTGSGSAGRTASLH